MTLSCATGFPDKTRKPPKKSKNKIKRLKDYQIGGETLVSAGGEGSVCWQVEKRSNDHALRASSQGIARQNTYAYQIQSNEKNERY